MSAFFIGERLYAEVGSQLQEYADNGVRFEPQVCLLQCPEDLKKAEDIINLGHTFYLYDTHKEDTFYARDIVHSKAFAIRSHMEEILKRAIKEHHVVMHYQPIYNVHVGNRQAVLHKVLFTGSEVCEFPAVTNQVSKLTDIRGRNKAPADKIVLEDIRDPLGVFLVGFLAANCFDVLRVCKNDIAG